MKLVDNKDVEIFLQDILDQVKFKQAHKEIKLEYLTHIEESAKLGISYGLKAEEAVSDAVRRMGTPGEIGHQLNQIHIPRIDLSIVISTITLCLVGIYSLSTLGFAGLQTVWTAIGLLVGAGVTFVSPAHLIKASGYLYGITFALLAIAHFSGVSDLGQPYLSVSPLKIKIVDLSAVFFLVSIAGLIFRFPVRSVWRLPVILVLALLPVIYFASINSVYPGILYFASSLILLASAKISWKAVTFFTLISLLALSIANTAGNFVTPENFKSILSSEAHTDFIFHHMVSSLPTAALLTLLAFGLLVARAITISSEIKNPFSSAIFKSALVMISIGAVWGLFSGLGYIPMPQTGVNLPFISYGGSLMVAHCALIGILLGSVRTKTLSVI